METLNDDGQWIVMMGFIVAIGMFMLAIVLPGISGISDREDLQERFRGDIALLSMSRNNAIANYSVDGSEWTAAGTYEDIFYTYHQIDIHYNNGITEYTEALLLPERRP
jgi:hypothetical protein